MKHIVLFVFFIGCVSTHGQSIQVSNNDNSYDSKGHIVDVHDGRVIKFNDTFYWYGTTYGTTNGFTSKNHYSVYSSNDLKTWKHEGRLLPDQPTGVYYRPHVIYNKKNDNYVLWYNWYPKLWEGRFGVAVSKSPTGPFDIINDDVKMVNSDIGLGDFGLFVDDDLQAYISYNTIKDHQVSIEKLDDDYTGSTMLNGGVIAKHMEAGSQFKRNGKYYLLTDYTCCFCNEGSGARVYVSEDPLSGYQFTGNINRYPGKFSSVLNDGVKTGTVYQTVQKQDSVFQAIELNFTDASRPTSMEIALFTGNRPANCGDVDNPRVHPEFILPEFEFSYWDYDHWENITVQKSKIDKSAISARMTYVFPDIQATRIRIKPNSNYPFDAVYMNEIEIANISFRAYLTGPGIPQRPIIPAQQTYVMALESQNGTDYIWMGDLWGSASDGVKGHDYQYWSAPLEFNSDGTIQPLQWTDAWEVELKDE